MTKYKKSLDSPTKASVCRSASKLMTEGRLSIDIEAYNIATDHVNLFSLVQNA